MSTVPTTRMAKNRKGKQDPEKKASLQARKEAKAEKAVRKRLDKEVRGGLIEGNGHLADGSQDQVLDELLRQYTAHDLEAIESPQVETLDGFPLARANASLTLYDDTKKKNAELYLFGGEFYDGIENIVLDHLLSFNLTKNEWKRIHTPTSPPARCAHSCVYYNHSLFVFGGEVVSAHQYHHYKDIWRFDLKTLRWEEIKPSKAIGCHPSARSGHTALVWKNFMILFGGFYEAMKDTPRWYDDVCILDLRTYQWLDIPHSRLAIRPEPRSACNTAIIGDKMIVHGGFSKLSKGNSLSRSTPLPTTQTHDASSDGPVITSETKVHNDAWMLRLKPLLSNEPPTWERLTSTIKKGSLNTSKNPNGRAGTSAVAFKDKLLSFGGVVDAENLHHKINSVFYADLSAFDAERRKWFPVHVTNSSSAVKRARRRKQKTVDVTNQEAETGDESGEDAEVELEEELEEEDIGGGITENGWDLEKLRSNMFAFIDGAGNVVYERFDDSDNEENGDEDKHLERETEVEQEEEKDVEGDSEESKHEEQVDEQSKLGCANQSHSPGQLVSSSSVMVVNQETNQPEAVARGEPLPRINSKLVVGGNILYMYGGLLEIGDREITLDDMWSLDLRKRDKWICIWGGTMHKQVWRGAVHDDDDSYYSSNDFARGEGDDDEEEEKEESEQNVETKSTEKNKRSEIRARMNEIVKENDMSDEARTPNPLESLSDFYARTSEFWNGMAAELSSKEVRREGFNLAKKRYEELGQAMKELDELDRLYKESKRKDVKK